MKLYYIKGVSTLSIDTERCTGCGNCVDVCPHAVICMNQNKAFIADKDACMECGACRQNCPAEAVSVDTGVGCAEYLFRAVVSKNNEGSCGCGGSSCC